MQRTTSRTVVMSTAAVSARTRMLLTCGVFVGPVFYIVALAQILTRPGFDIRHHAISLLSLGQMGWVQIANFIVTGVLALLFAIGMRALLGSGRGGTWGPLLIGAYGVGLIVGGLFHPDPGLGFPPGAPAGMPATMSGHALVHTIAFYLAFLSVLACTFVFARRFFALRERAWAIYCLFSGVLSILLIVLGMVMISLVGLILAIAGAIAFGWISVLAVRLGAEFRAQNGMG